MTPKHCKCFIVLFLCTYAFSFAQNKKTDSLLNVVHLAKKDSNEVKALYELITEMQSTGNYEKGFEYANDAIDLAKKINFKKGEAKAHGNMGLLYSDQNKLQEAIDQHTIALKLLQELDDKLGMGSSYTNLGHIYLDQGNLNEALKNYSAALTVRKAAKDTLWIGHSYHDLGNVYQMLGDNEASLKNNLEALKMRIQINDKEWIAASYDNIGTNYRVQGSYAEALKNYFASLKLYSELDNKNGTANNYDHIGIVNSIQGNYAEALKNHILSLTIREAIKDKRGLAASYNNIGVLYFDQNNYSEALRNYFLALKMEEEIGNKSAVVSNYNNIGNVFKQQGDILSKQKNHPDSAGIKYTEALKYHFNALKVAEEIGNNEGVAISYGNMGNVYAGQNDLAKALTSFHNALKIFEDAEMKQGSSLSYLNIGEIYKDLAAATKPPDKEKMDSALFYLNKGLTLIKEMDAKSELIQAYSALQEVYKNIGDYKKAFEYATLLSEVTDSLFNTETSRKLEQLRTEYEVEKAVGEEKLQQEKLALEEKMKNEKIIADEKSRHDKALYEENFLHQMAMAKEKNNREQLLLKQKLMSEKEFADEKARQEKIESDEKQRHQLALYQEQIRHEKAVSDEKHTQQKLLAQKDRKNNMLLTGAALIFITGIFIILFIKQRNQKKIAVEKANAIHKMAELEMQSLRTQLNPHFMFNSLNSIQELILLEENERSHSYLSRFAKLLRMLLENAEKPFISIRKELDFLQLYLSLENLRVPDLQYSISTDPKINSDETLIPNMILQPYIENAIWHGLSHREKNRQLQIRIYRENGTVNYEIEDNGVGRKKAEELKSLFRQKHQSKGMELLSKRFKLLNEEYSSDIHTDITDIIRNNEVAGTLVTIKVPVKLSEHLLN